MLIPDDDVDEDRRDAGFHSSDGALRRRLLGVAPDGARHDAQNGEQ
jgi:hypothetical protein